MYSETEKKRFNYIITGYESAGYKITKESEYACYLQSILNRKSRVHVSMDGSVTKSFVGSEILSEVVDPLHVKSLLERGRLFEKYDNNEYTFKPPPVCTARWTKGNWVNFIFSVEWNKCLCSRYYNTII